MSKEERCEKHGGKLIDMLETIAWINLVCSVIGAIFIWFNFGKIDVGRYNDEINPTAVIVCISLIITGVIALIIMLSIAHILANSIAIREQLFQQSDIMKSDSSISKTESVLKSIKAIAKETKTKEVMKEKPIEQEKPITYAEDLGYQWKCTCGNINDSSEGSCSQCKSNKDYILANFSQY